MQGSVQGHAHEAPACVQLAPRPGSAANCLRRTLTMRCAPSGAAAWRLTPRRPTQLQGTRGTGPAGRFQIFHAMLAVGAELRGSMRLQTSLRGCLTSMRGCDDLGAWLPDLGAWLPDLGAWLPDLGAWLHDLGAWLPDLGALLPDLGVWCADLGAWLPDLGAWLD